MSTTHRLLAAVLLLATACLASPNQQAAGNWRNNPDKTYDCNYEQPTGSNIPKATCRSERQKEEERQAAQDNLRRMQDLSLRPGISQ